MQRLIICLAGLCFMTSANAGGLVRTNASAKWSGEHIIISSHLEDHSAPAQPPQLFLAPRTTLSASTLFALNSFQVRQSTALTTLISSLATLPPSRIKVVGYTDSTGSVRGNLALSQRRAQAVMMILRQAAPQHRYETDGQGEANPVATNSNRAGRASNRRVTVEVLNAI